MAEQKISIVISDRTYCLKASSPENEEVIRKAANVINQKVSNYRKQFLGKPEVDILSFVALNECITNIKLNDQIERNRKEAEEFEADLGSYIDNIVKNGR